MKLKLKVDLGFAALMLVYHRSGPACLNSGTPAIESIIIKFIRF